MKIDIVGKSDYAALFLGRPGAFRMKASEPLAARLNALPRAVPGEPRTVMLLGATGFVGMHLLRELLQRKDVSKVYALVRKKRASSPEARLANSVHGYRLAIAPDDRLEVIDADFTANRRFGLTDSRYEELRRTVDVIVNAAGATNHTLPYAYFRRESIVPLLHMMEFCATDRRKSLHFIGSMNGEVFRSKKDFFRVGFYHCGYSRMKWIVRQIANWAKAEGLTTAIYMSPHVVGSSLTEFKDPGLRYSFWHMIWYASQLQKVWASDVPVPVISADAMARAVCDNALSDEPRTFVYPTTYVAMADLAKVFGWTLVSWKEFRSEIRRTFPISLKQWDMRKPFSSFFNMFLHVFFTRALFTKDLPELITALTTAGQRSEPPVLTELPPSRFIHSCARQNYIIGRTIAGPLEGGAGVHALEEGRG